MVGNDTAEVWEGDLLLSRLSFAGDVITRVAVSVVVPPRSSATVPLPAQVAEATDAASELVTASLGGVRGTWFFAEPRDSALGGAPARGGGGAGGRRVRRDRHGGIARARCHAARRQARPGGDGRQGLVTLLPGESAVFRVRGVEALTAERLAAPGVLRSANQLVGP